MKKILLPGDSIVIDDVELGYEEIKQLVITDYKYSQLSNFIQTTFAKKDGVTSEH